MKKHSLMMINMKCEKVKCSDILSEVIEMFKKINLKHCRFCLTIPQHQNFAMYPSINFKSFYYQNKNLLVIKYPITVIIIRLTVCQYEIKYIIHIDYVEKTV